MLGGKSAVVFLGDKASVDATSFALDNEETLQSSLLVILCPLRILGKGNIVQVVNSVTLLGFGKPLKEKRSFPQ